MRLPGRPKNNAPPQESPKMINFRADREVLEALEALEAVVVLGSGVRITRKKSIVIRQLILAAARNLKKQ